MSDHRVNIIKSANEYTASAREEHENGEFDCLEIEVWRKNGDDESRRVEFLLGCGGPTIRVVVLENDYVEFHHSWGKNGDEDDAPDRIECDFRSSDREFWVQLANEMAELHT